MDYGKTLSRAWSIVWENKWLFVLGFLAALGGGGGSTGSNFSTSPPGSPDSSLPGDFLETLSDIAPFIVAGVCLLILLGIALWLLRLIGEAGMIASVDRIESGEKLTLREGFRAGVSHLKSMVVLSLLLYGPFLIIGLIMAGFAISLAIGAAEGNSAFAGGLGLASLCILPLICLMGLAGLVVSFIYPFAQRGIIIRGLRTREGIRHGWEILKANFTEIIILGVIFLVISFAVGLVALFIAVPLAFLFVIPAAIAVIQGGQVLTAATIILGVLGLIAFILLSAAITSIVRTFQSTAFTLGYHQWAGKTPPKPAL
jgi:hypothetical protein